MTDDGRRLGGVSFRSSVVGERSSRRGATMELVLANHSSYPRVGASREQQRLRRAYAQRERGEISADDFNRAQDSAVAEVIEEQARVGCELLTDGQIRWVYSISHLAGRLNQV